MIKTIENYCIVQFSTNLYPFFFSFFFYKYKFESQLQSTFLGFKNTINKKYINLGFSGNISLDSRGNLIVFN
jgi:hypothetical protein